MMNSIEKLVHLAAVDNVNSAALAIRACIEAMSDEQKQDAAVQVALHEYRTTCGAWIAACSVMMAANPGDRS